MKKGMWMGAVVLCGLLAGCASPEPAKTADPVVLDEKANGTVVKAKVGDRFCVKIPSNPTTGYGWEFSAPEDGAIALDKNAFSPPENKNGMCGVPGAHELLVRAVKPGRAVLKGICCRPWQKPDWRNDRTFVLTVDVE